MTMEPLFAGHMKVCFLGLACMLSANTVSVHQGLRAETHQSAKAHETVAKNLDMMVLRPFSTWSHAHEGRVADLKSQLDETIVDWQGLSAEVGLAITSLQLCSLR